MKQILILLIIFKIFKQISIPFQQKESNYSGYQTYCDGFYSFYTDYWSPGDERLHVLVSCNDNEGTMIYDFDTMTLKKKWIRNYGGDHEHCNTISMYGTIIICLEDYDGLEALDYTTEGPNTVQGSILIPRGRCSHSYCVNPSADEPYSVHRLMVQYIDPVTQQGGKFIYGYETGAIRYTKLENNSSTKQWQELRSIPYLAGSTKINGISQLTGTSLVIISTNAGFEIVDASDDNLPEISITTNVSSVEFKSDYALHIKGTRLMVTYNISGHLRIFDFTPPDVYPIHFTLVKKEYIGYVSGQAVYHMESISGRQFSIYTTHHVRIYNIDLIDSGDINTTYGLILNKQWTPQNNESGGVYQIPNTNYIMYNDHFWRFYIDKNCHYSCEDCNVNDQYGKCTSCATTSNSSIDIMTGNPIVLERTLQSDQTCECVDPLLQCEYIDIGGQFCYHKNMVGNQPTYCCGANSCINDEYQQLCEDRTSTCKELPTISKKNAKNIHLYKKINLVFDPDTGYWYPKRNNPDFECHYSCAYCLENQNENSCRGCDTTISHRELETNPGKCLCKEGYYDDGTNFECVVCNSNCKACINSTQCSSCPDIKSMINRVLNTCLCESGYTEENNACVLDCNTASTNKELVFGVCECLTGYFLANPGDISCTFCTNPTNKDLNNCQCSIGYEQSGDICLLDCQTSSTHKERSSEDYSAQCVCEWGYELINPTDLACTEKTCVSKCQTCDRGICQQCFNPNNRDTQTCECNTGYEEVGNLCLKDCQTSITKMERDLNDLDTCICQNGYYLANPGDNSCTFCNFPTNKNTKTCQCINGYEEKSNGECRVDCLTSSTNKENSLSDESICVCLAGYFLENVGDFKCIFCDNPQHKDPSTCQCVAGYEKVNDICKVDCQNSLTNKERSTLDDTVCVCQSGYYLANAGDQQCKFCNNPAHKDSTTCQCIAGYEEVSGVCKVDCENSLTNKERSNLDDTICVCQSGYYLANPGDYQCIFCDNPAHKDPTTCQCIAGYEEVNDICKVDCKNSLTNKERSSSDDTICVCQSGYYLANVGDYQCKFCDNPAHKDPTTCQCISGYEEVNDVCKIDCENSLTNKERSISDDTVCVCQSGYYLANIGDYQCTFCNNPANKDSKTCQCIIGYEDVSGVCKIDCENNLTNKQRSSLDDTVCVCQFGYYLANVGDYQCTFCSNPDNKDPATCQCNTGYEDISGVCKVDCQTLTTNKERSTIDETQCVCINGYYLVNPSDATCNFCSDPQNKDIKTCTCLVGYELIGNLCLLDCKTSNTNKIRNPNDLDSCICDQGYFLENSGDSICKELPCGHRCEICSLGVCQKCFNPDHRDKTTCDCLNGYEDVNNVCLIDCQNDQTNKKRSTVDNTQCVCQTGYYLEKIGDFQCTFCDNPQNKNLNTCQCLPGYEEVNDICKVDCENDITNKERSTEDDTICICQPGYYLANIGDYQCTICNNPVNKDPSSCSCIAGYEEVNNICKIDCKNNLTNKERSTSDDTICVCQSGYYLANADDYQCTFCKNPQNKDPSTCKCLQGYEDVNRICKVDCQTQNSFKKRDINDDTQCVCIDGYYLDQLNDFACTELLCNPKCAICSLGQCLQCIGTDQNRNLQTCECMDTYIDIDNVCEFDCQTQQTNKVLVNNECVCKEYYKNINNVCHKKQSAYGREDQIPYPCKQDHFEISESVHCLKCEQQCNQCEQFSNNCTECVNPQFQPPFCKSFKFSIISQEKNSTEICDQQIACQKCNYDNGLCLKCKRNSNREVGIYGKCVCKSGFKEFRDQVICQKCYFYKGECVLQCPVYTIQDNEYNECIQKQLKITENSFQIIISFFIIFGAVFFYLLCEHNKIQLIINNYKIRRTYQQEERIKKEYEKFMEYQGGSQSLSEFFDSELKI